MADYGVVYKGDESKVLDSRAVEGIQAYIRGTLSEARTTAKDLDYTSTDAVLYDYESGDFVNI